MVNPTAIYWVQMQYALVQISDALVVGFDNALQSLGILRSHVRDHTQPCVVVLEEA